MADEPQFIRCEGSGAEHDGYCPMCGARSTSIERLPEHVRVDIIAMIERGDFDVR